MSENEENTNTESTEAVAPEEQAAEVVEDAPTEETNDGAEQPVEVDEHAEVEGDAEEPDEATEDEAADAPSPFPKMARSPLSAAITELVDEKKNLRDKWLRTAADFENFKKRSRRDIVERAKQVEDRMVLDFLPVVDNLERALEHGEGGEGALLSGVDMVYKQFLSTLERYGITPCEAMGEPFDPEFHEAIQQMHADQEAGSVCNVLQRGYRRRERLVRAALVVVSLGPAPDAEDAEEEPAEAEEPETTEESTEQAIEAVEGGDEGDAGEAGDADGGDGGDEETAAEAEDAAAEDADADNEQQ